MFFGPALKCMCMAAVAWSMLWWAAGCAPSRGVYHAVEPGQTLYQIGRTYQIDVEDLARVNGIKDPTRLKVGSRLLIPGADRKRAVPVTALATKGGNGEKADRSPSVSTAPASAPGNGHLSSRRSTPAEPGGKTVPSSAPSPRFIWPLKGKILKKFSSQGTSPSKGIEIAAAEGTAVAAVAPGQVIYSGDGIPSFGNLIIIKHDGGYFSVYGYNRKNVVKTGAFVGKGDRIALSGSPPSKGQPRLYFEIRYGKEARDPIFFLP